MPFYVLWYAMVASLKLILSVDCKYNFVFDSAGVDAPKSVLIFFCVEGCWDHPTTC